MKFEDLIGKTIIKIEGAEKDSERIAFICSDNTSYQMLHYQDCCEDVRVEDVCGDIQDLLNTPIIKASEDTNSESDPEGYCSKEFRDDSFTWTFYNITTIKGHVTIRWFGTSNGYYSESVSLEVI
jgi:hypothetical protein